MANQHAFGPFWMRSNFTPWGKYNLCQYRFYSSNVQTLLLPHWRQFFPINRVLWFLYEEKKNVSKYNNGLFTQMKFTCHRDFGNRFFPAPVNTHSIVVTFSEISHKYLWIYRSKVKKKISSLFPNIREFVWDRKPGWMFHSAQSNPPNSNKIPDELWLEFLMLALAIMRTLSSTTALNNLLITVVTDKQIGTKPFNIWYFMSETRINIVACEIEPQFSTFYISNDLDECVNSKPKQKWKNDHYKKYWSTSSPFTVGRNCLESREKVAKQYKHEIERRRKPAAEQTKLRKKVEM